MMDLEDIQSARSRERRTDSLQPLADSFYAEAGEFVAELRAKRKEVAAEADDPFDSSEVRRLTNSIETAENTVEAIYERRVGKVLKLASLDAAGMSTDDDGLTPEERELFRTVTDAIERNRRQVIEGVATTENDAGTSETAAASAGEPTAAPDPTPDTNTDIGADADGAHGTEAPRADSDRAPEAPEPPTEEPADERATNSIADDVRAEETRNEPRNGNGDGYENEEGKAEPMGAADAMGAPAGTASEPSTDSGRETDGGVSAADGRSEAATGTEDTATDPSVVPEPSAGARTDGEERTSSEDGSRAADADGENRTPSMDGTTETADRETVRITRDVGEIVGIDERVYELASEDIVQLPTANAKPLVDRDAAERLE